MARRLLALALPMRLIAALLAATIGTVAPQTDPSVAAGIAAYDRGDFAASLAILKPLVFETPTGPGFLDPDPFALAYLGQMYRRGDAAPADWPLSCALSDWPSTRRRSDGRRAPRRQFRSPRTGPTPSACRSIAVR